MNQTNIVARIGLEIPNKNHGKYGIKGYFLSNSKNNKSFLNLSIQNKITNDDKL